MLAEYNHDAPPAGSDSEAEEDNSGNFREDDVPQESAMNAVSSPPPLSCLRACVPMDRCSRCFCSADLLSSLLSYFNAVVHLNGCARLASTSSC